MCLPCEPGPPSPRRPQPGSISPPPHAPMRRRLCFCAGLNPSLAGGYFCGFGGDPKRRPRASFSLCQERDTLSRVGMASGRCRFLPHPLTGTDWSEGGGGPRLSQQTGASAFMPSLWSSPDQPWSPPRGSGAGVRYENTQWPWCARPLNRQAP